MELESNQEPKNLVSTSAAASLSAILVMFHQTKCRFELWQEFESNPYGNYVLFVWFGSILPSQQLWSCRGGQFT